MMRNAISTLLVAIAVSATAQAGNVTLVSTGMVAGGSMTSGPLAGAGFGDTVTMTFDVITPGSDVTPGQYVNYTIDPSSMVIEVGSAIAGMTNPGLAIGLQNDMPASDGLRLFFGPNNLGNGLGLGFELGLLGSTFSNTNIADQLGDITFADLTSYNWEIHGGGSLFIDWMGTTVQNGALGTPYCFGDGSATPCPCANTGGAGTGCANSTGVGATLVAVGSDSVVTDDATFFATGMVPNQPALLFAGNNAIASGAGTIFGDGLRCAGGSVVRLGVQTPDAQGAASWGPGLGAVGGWAAGDVRRFQAWYRDPVGSPCGTLFNLSSGLEIQFN
jgi:hypothetical protein